MSKVRWFVHWALVPFLLVVCLRLGRNASLPLSSRLLVMPLAYVLSLVLAVIDVWEGFMPP
eukprot:2409245-Prorocentrum_lima.AAC.1